jgi:maleate isomerase
MRAPTPLANRVDMSDRFGPRGVIALFIPLQNANMQPEYEAMRPRGVSNQIYRFSLANHASVPQAAIGEIEGGLGCWPDLVVVGNSVEMRGLSPPQFADYRAKLRDKIGEIPLVTATDATVAALKTMGARRIAVISPMSDDYSRYVADYYEALGFEVPYHCGLQVARSQDIIKLGAAEARAAFLKLDHDDVDTFLHVGGALGIVDHIEALEKDLGRPVISVNVASYWCALRTLGIGDPLTGFGQLAQKPLRAS